MKSCTKLAFIKKVNSHFWGLLPMMHRKKCCQGNYIRQIEPNLVNFLFAFGPFASS